MSCTRMFGLFTLEMILAVAFGRAVNVQRGEADEITGIAATLFAGFQEDTALRVVMELIGGQAQFYSYSLVFILCMNNFHRSNGTHKRSASILLQ